MEQQLPVGFQRFRYFLDQLQQMINKAGASGDPALSLYQQGVRTPLFMLEALSRLYMNAHEKKPFKKLRELFKNFEDKLGAVDYYDGFGKEFATNENIPQEVKAFIQTRMNEKLGELKALLEDKGWTGAENKRMRKVTAKLEKADWPATESDSAALKEYYSASIGSITQKMNDGEINFDNVEEDVHELRREIRWLSIYPHALRGLMQLKPGAATPDYLTKYLLPEVISSPFNKMPDADGQKDIIYLSRDHFLAMSWLIAELGKLKDSGLRIEVLQEALMATQPGIDKQTLEEKTASILGEGQMPMVAILERSKEISRIFFSENVLQQLLA